MAAKANQVQVMRGKLWQRRTLLDLPDQHPELPADAAAACARRIRGGRSGPSMTTLAAQDGDNTVTSRAGPIIAGISACWAAPPRNRVAHMPVRCMRPRRRLRGFGQYLDLVLCGLRTIVAWAAQAVLERLQWVKT